MAMMIEGRLLTRREREVVHMLAADYTNKEVAQMLGLSYHTIRNHVRTAQLKVGATTQVGLVIRALEQEREQGPCGLHP